MDYCIVVVVFISYAFIVSFLVLPFHIFVRRNIKSGYICIHDKIQKKKIFLVCFIHFFWLLFLKQPMSVYIKNPMNKIEQNLKMFCVTRMWKEKQNHISFFFGSNLEHTYIERNNNLKRYKPRKCEKMKRKFYKWIVQMVVKKINTFCVM